MYIYANDFKPMRYVSSIILAGPNFHILEKVFVMAELLRLSSIRIVPSSLSSESLSRPPYSHLAPESNPLDAWLPITASRNGNVYRSAFHILNSGIGIQALSLPVAFTYLGWIWGIACLLMVFLWQFYTIWLLIQLHESVPGTRYSRYIHLSIAAFGEKLGKLLVLFPTMYLSGGSCVLLIITAGGCMKHFLEILLEHAWKSKSLTLIEWNLVLVILAVIVAQQHPNLNSIAGVSLVGAITALAYCTTVWVISVTKTRMADLSYNPVKATSSIAGAFNTFNALGIIALAFRGHNLVLEIQATMPSSEERPSRVQMWRAAKFAYLVIALCMFPLAIGLFWAYGNKLQHANGEILNVLLKIHHRHDTRRIVLGFASLVIVINSLSSFQVYAMPAFDKLTFTYTSRKKGPCSLWVHSGIRVFFGCVVFFITVALPFIVNLAGVIGGIALPVTLAYPCFMWIVLKKPKQGSTMWCVNWVLGSLGMVLSILVFAGGIWGLVNPGINIRFFKP